MAKFVFWRLPSATRQALQGPRHNFVRWVRELPAPVSVTPELANNCPSDLSWEDFSAQILSRRGEYKGIFVQELAIDWNVPLYQRPQHIATAFGRLGYLVIYKTDNWVGDNVDGFREVSKNVWITNRDEVNKIEDVVRSFYSTAFQNTPELMLKNGKRGVLVYEYIDHIDPQICGDDTENIRRLLAIKDFAFGGGADYIVASARKLEAEAVMAVGRDKVILVQNGVDTLHYRNPIHQSTPLPVNLIAFKKKYSNIVGYFGALAPWLWYEVVSELVEARPDLGFVFIGPDYLGGLEKLPKAENVLYLGTVDYKILPAYARQFDICFIPFAPGEIARTTSPLKLFEYFALEKPVVVTSEMLECVAFKEVFSGDSASTLSQAIDQAILVKNIPDFKDKLAQLADQNNWDERARAMAVVFNLINGCTSDLSWEDFSAQILSRRGEYKGIFVQELVIDWNVPRYQRPQHIATAFGRLGYLVIYKTDNWVGDNVDGFREVSKNVWITNRDEVNKIEGVVRSFYSTAYANTPELMLKNCKRGVLVYEYIDHIDPQISGDDTENIRRLLALKYFAFGGGADYIVASAGKLEAEAVKAVGRDKVILAQNGVDTVHYRNPIHQSTPLPENLRSFQKKILKHRRLFWFARAVAMV